MMKEKDGYRSEADQHARSSLGEEGRKDLLQIANMGLRPACLYINITCCHTGTVDSSLCFDPHSPFTRDILPGA